MNAIFLGRILLTGILLILVYTETGLFTVLCLSLIVLHIELRGHDDLI